MLTIRNFTHIKIMYSNTPKPIASCRHRTILHWMMSFVFCGSFLGHAATLTVVPATSFTGEAATKPGFDGGWGLYRGFDTTNDAAFSGNGTARSAVVKDTLAGYSGIHNAAYLNDGYYGNGASWIPATSNSWIKIDLGKELLVSSITFGRDRLGYYDDRDPGQFTVATAISDDFYVNGNSSNDGTEYTNVFSSISLGFSGLITTSQTLEAKFTAPVTARYIKLTVTNYNTAIDEIEVTAVPEPSSAGLFIFLSLAGVVCRHRRSA